MKTTASAKGKIVPPADLREQDSIEPGEELTAEHPSTLNEGVVEWLMSCPEKGFFVPIESESTG